MCIETAIAAKCSLGVVWLPMPSSEYHCETAAETPAAVNEAFADYTVAVYEARLDKYKDEELRVTSSTGRNSSRSALDSLLAYWLSVNMPMRRLRGGCGC